MKVKPVQALEPVVVIVTEAEVGSEKEPGMVADEYHRMDRR